MILEKLKKCLKSEQKDKNILDIVVYGSLVKGKFNPNDIDIAVIFKEGKLNDRLNKVQEIKKQIEELGKIDIKAILFEELFNESFFARSGIFLDGISLFSGKSFSNRIDFESFAVFVYSLIDKTHNEKVKFNYILSGRNREGVVKKLEGKVVAPSVVQIPIKNSFEFEHLLKTHNIKFNRMDILVKR